MNWIEEGIKYPWHLPVAMQLHRMLAQTKPSKDMAMHLAEMAGLDTGYIDPDKPIIILWKNILDIAKSDGLLKELLLTVLNNINARHPQRRFIEELLATGAGDVEAEPVDAEGRPDFIKDDDNITEKESLLFRDDLTLPIGKLRALIATLEKLNALAPAVCRMVITIGTTIQYGTGFRIGKKMLLTNHHVVHSKNAGTPATAVSAQFGYDDNGQGGFLPGIVFACDVATIKAHKESDWAVLLANDELPESIPIIDLNTGVPAKLEDQAFIIQHPQAGTKRIGYVRNSVSNVNDSVAHYLTDTEEGASGAPVFNEEGKIIAVHRAGGRPIELPGKQPMKKNEGVLISRILKDFQNKNIVVV